MSTGDIIQAQTYGFAASIVLPWLTAFVLALLPVLGGMVLALLRKHNLDNAFFQAVARAGGVAYTSLLASGRPVTDRAALASAALAGATYLQQRVPGLVQARGLQPGAVADIAGAELGKLLASDPSLGPPK